MLRPLDPHRLDALARESDDDEGVEFLLHCHLERIRKNTKEGGDWAYGVQAILHEGGDFLAFMRRTSDLSYEEKQRSNEWCIDFCVRAVDPTHGSAITDSPSSNFLSRT